MTRTVADADVGTARSARHGSVEVAACLALALAPYLWRVLAGTRRLPNDDTWAYERILAEYLDTGRIVLIDWNDITLLGMLPLTRAWTWIVGEGPLQVHLLGSLMGAVVLLAFRDLLGTVGARHVLLGIASVGAFSGFVVVTGTYMSDLFALAGSMVALAAAARLVARPRSGAGWVGLVALVVAGTVFAFSVRQQSAVATGITGLLLLVGRSRAGSAWLVAGAGFVALAGPLYLWRAGMEDGGGVIVLINTRLILASWVLMGIGLCVALLPVLLRTGGRELLGSLALRGVASLLAGFAAAAMDPSDLVNDYLSVLRRAAELGPAGRAVVAVVLVNVVLTAIYGLLTRRLDLSDPLGLGLVLGVVVSLVAEAAVIFLSSDYYSRYSTFTLALLVALVARSERRVATEVEAPVRRATSSRLAWGALALSGFAAYWTLDHAQTAVRASSDLAEVAACLGVPADELDAGLVWMGTHSDDVAVSAFRDRPMIEDGLPVTQHHRVFPDYVRNAVVLDHEPAVADGVTVVGSVDTAGLLPGNGVTRWLVVRGDVSADVDRCT